MVRNPNRNLEGKVALITGSGRGIGNGIALELASRGANIVVNYAHSEKAATELAKQIEDLGSKALVVQADISKTAEVQKLVETAFTKMGPLDILVNNAGVEKQAPFWEVTEEDYETVVNLNLKAVFFTTQAVVQRWIKSKRKGKIINVSSVHEQMPFPGYASYCASKGGVGMLTKTLAVELGPHGITVNGIAPGAILTEINAKLEADKPRMEALEAKIPLRRMGTVQDVSKIAGFLAGPDSDYVTAATYYVDGGLLWNYEE